LAWRDPALTVGLIGGVRATLHIEQREFHFETGRPLAERLGYPPADLDRIPAAAIDSFAGVGYFLDLAVIAPGETVLDLGSGAGMDSFLAALATGPTGA
jgi:protein-L-isoaspartate O-methyltransferase